MDKDTNNTNNTNIVAQYFVQIYIEDYNNSPELRKYAKEIKRWLQKEDTKLDHVFEQFQFVDYGIFLIDIMEKYWHYAIENAEPTLRSLQMQRKKHEEREMMMRQMAMTCIFDSGYRGYD